MSTADKLKGVQVALIYTLPLRLFLAYEWLNSGSGKLSAVAADPNAGASLANVFGTVWTKTNPYPWMVDFLKNTAAPNAASLYAWVAIGEMLVGLFLLVGLASRLSSSVGILMNLFFYFAAGHTSPSTAGVNLVMIGAQLTFLLVPPGRILGVDQVLVKRLPKIPLW